MVPSPLSRFLSRTVPFPDSQSPGLAGLDLRQLVCWVPSKRDCKPASPHKAQYPMAPSLPPLDPHAPLPLPLRPRSPPLHMDGLRNRAAAPNKWWVAPPLHAESSRACHLLTPPLGARCQPFSRAGGKQAPPFPLFSRAGRTSNLTTTTTPPRPFREPRPKEETHQL